MNKKIIFGIIMSTLAIMIAVVIVASLNLGLFVSEESFSELNRSAIFNTNSLYSYQSDYFIYQTKIVENNMFYSQSYELENHYGCLVDLDSQNNETDDYEGKYYYYNFRTKNDVIMTRLDSLSEEYTSSNNETEQYGYDWNEKEMVDIPAKSKVRIDQKFSVQGTNSMDVNKYDELLIIKPLDDEEWGRFDLTKYYDYCSRLNVSGYKIVKRVKLVGDIYNQQNSYNQQVYDQQSPPKTPDYSTNWTKCNETDNGKDFSNAGTTIETYAIDGLGGIINMGDNCVTDDDNVSYLVEYYCISDSISSYGTLYSSQLVKCDCDREQRKCRENVIPSTSQYGSRKVAFWCGKVNQHFTGETWVTDSDGASFCNVTPLNYCKKFWPDTKKAVEGGTQKINTWQNAGNIGLYSSPRMTYDCLP